MQEVKDDALNEPVWDYEHVSESVLESVLELFCAKRDIEILLKQIFQLTKYLCYILTALIVRNLI